jgi:hypothetical protein
MNDPIFWAHLSNEFRALDCDCLRVDWSASSDNPPILDIAMFSESTSTCVSKRKALEALAIQAGYALEPNAQYPALVWLERLIRDLEVPRSIQGTSRHPDRSGIERHWTRLSIENPCHASAIVCSNLQINAIQQQRQPAVQPASNTASQATPSQASPAFPNRAVWFRNELHLRGWDQNDIPRFGGPDRKTALKVMRGEYVKPSMLEKLLTPLNRKKIQGQTITLSDFPSD